MEANEQKNAIEKCPTCGGDCTMSWSGLDLVSNTGDETLAQKHYKAHIPELSVKLLEALKFIEPMAKMNKHQRNGTKLLIAEAERSMKCQS